MRSIASILAALTLAACAGAPLSDGAVGTPKPLAGTSWRLAELISPDDAIGSVRPDDPGKYEMTLGADGAVSMRLDCNRGTGTWSSAVSDPLRGGVTFGPLAMTRAMCPKGSLDARIARELPYVRTYDLGGDRLVLNLMADGGDQVWTRVPQ